MGPTATGKSELALKICKAINGEVINADAMQIYKGLDIGTSKLKEEEWEGIPHHLFSFLEPYESYSSGRFLNDALKIIEDIKKRGKFPVIVGGTGFYIKSLLKGLDEIPQIEKNFRLHLKKLIENKGKENFYKILSFLDPVYAKKISKNDKQRIERALEVIFITGKRFSDFFKGANEREDRFPSIKIGLFLKKEELKKKIELRVKKMLKEGWIREVKNLIEKNISPESQSFKSIGYRELLMVIEGKLKIEEAEKIIIKKTIAYAKRQMTWFKKDKDIFWINSSDMELAFLTALRYIKEKIKGEFYGK